MKALDNCFNVDLGLVTIGDILPLMMHLLEQSLWNRLKPMNT